MIKGLHKALILSHRYLGIAIGLLFVVWFLSGIGIMFTRGMPNITPEERLARTASIDFSKVHFSPSEALARAGADHANRAILTTLLDRPIYRIDGTLIYADDGTRLDAVDADLAVSVAARFMQVERDKLHYSFIEQPDQWTVAQRRQLPFHKITVDDDARSELYISPKSGEIAVLTTRTGRALAWVAAIPHWLYFTRLRADSLLWNRVVVWSSAVGCVMALLGILLAFTQFKGSRPVRLSRLSSYIPYSGWMRWHYITGGIFGIFTLTWVFSGLLSMEPWAWASGEDLEVNGAAFTGGPLDLAQYPKVDASLWAQSVRAGEIKELEFARIQGKPYYITRTPEPDRTLVAADSLQVRGEAFNTEALIQTLETATPTARIVEASVLTDYDSYYYDQARQQPLPILRAKFDDAKQTWVYVDPKLGRVAGQLHRGDRIQRWLYHGFHSLDFSFWYGNRPLWATGMVILNLGGAAMSGIGLWVGLKRVARWVRKQT